MQGTISESPDNGDQTRDVNKGAMALKSAMASLIGVHDKLHADLSYAKNEVAWETLFSISRGYLWTA